MKPTNSFALTVIACLLLSGCGQKQSQTNQAGLVRLFDILEPDDLLNEFKLPAPGWDRTEWQANAMQAWDGTNAAPALGFRAVADLEDPALSGSTLNARISGPAPMVQFALRDNRGGAGPIRAIELRMRVKGASQVWLRPDGSRKTEESVLTEWAKSKEWKISAAVEDNTVQTYRFDLTDKDHHQINDLRQFFLTFRDCDQADFAIESIRLVTAQEEKLKTPSGQQWAGLAEIYHETLAGKTSETFDFRLRALPDQPWFDVNIGTPEDLPVTFTASIVSRDSGDSPTPEVLFQRTLTTRGRWEPLRIDLARFAGKSVTLKLALTGDRNGLWGYWGSPVIRSSQVAATGPAAGKKPRGVIFMVVDTLRADHLNIYGYKRETLQHLKKFADEGVAFSNAISQGTWTKVSQSSMVTSLYPATHRVLTVPQSLPASAETIAEVYREAGYATVSYSSVEFTGKQNNMHQGYEELHEASSVPKETDSDGDQVYRSKTARPYVDRFIPWLQRHRDVPFFAYLHVFDPHSPFKPRPPYDSLWGRPGDSERIAEIDAQIKEKKVKNIFGLPHKDDYVAKTGNDPEELLRIYKDWYDGSIRGMDAEMGRLFEALRELGLEEDTLIVFVSDHGEEFWEHNQLFHGQTVYGELNQVPMVFRWPANPAIRKGVLVDQIVENLDIMPTLLDLSGIEGPSIMQGRSLVPLLDGSGSGTWQNRLVVTETGAFSTSETDTNGVHFGFIQNGLKVVRKEHKPATVEELFDRTRDRLDQDNLIDGEGQRARADALTETFGQWRARMEAVKLPADDELTKDLSSEELRRLQALGYVGGGVDTKPDVKQAPGTTNASPSQPTKTDDKP
ncbi:MAG: sulfatase [Verrucomicrobia bacterium]|nr:sulfatase [Verrucomicrobiota bacterium]